MAGPAVAMARKKLDDNRVKLKRLPVSNERSTGGGRRLRASLREDDSRSGPPSCLVRVVADAASLSERPSGPMFDEIHDCDGGTTVVDAEVEGAGVGALGLSRPELGRAVWVPEVLVRAEQACRARRKGGGVNLSLSDQRIEVFGSQLELDVDDVIHSLRATNADEARGSREPEVELRAERRERLDG
jgi:hypothetical protein